MRRGIPPKPVKLGSLEVDSCVVGAHLSLYITGIDGIILLEKLSLILDPFMTSLGKGAEIMNFFTFFFLTPFLGDNGEKIGFNFSHFFLLMFSINFLYYTSGESFSQIQTALFFTFY